MKPCRRSKRERKMTKTSTYGTLMKRLSLERERKKRTDTFKQRIHTVPPSLTLINERKKIKKPRHNFPKNLPQNQHPFYPPSLSNLPPPTLTDHRLFREPPPPPPLAIHQPCHAIPPALNTSHIPLPIPVDRINPTQINSTQLNSTQSRKGKGWLD